MSSKIKKGRKATPSRLLFAAAAAVAMTAARITRAGDLDIIGLTQLLNLNPTLTGAGVSVAQPETDINGTDTESFAVNPAAVGQPASLFTYTDDNGNVSNTFDPTEVSGHANNVAQYFYGVGTGVAPGVAHVDSMSADYFTSTIVTNLVPISDAVVNQSFLEDELDGSPLTVADQQLSDTQYDNYVALYGTIIVSGVGNGGAYPNPNAPSTAYNVISVGASPGPSSVGPTIDNGRSKPDITAPAGETSYSTPLVAGCAAILVQAGTAGDGGDSPQTEADAVDFRTVEALLLNGADKQSVTFNRTPTAPLDPTNGAGMVNVYNSYLQLAAGNFPAGSVDNTAAVGAAHPPDTSGPVIQSLLGWDFATITSSANTDAYANYLFQPPVGVSSYTATATLVWERQFNANTATPIGINTLDLFLYDLTKNTLIDESVSTVDNLQDVYDLNLAPGDLYDLQVLKNGGTPGITPGVVSDSETYALAFDFAPAQDVWTSPTGGSWANAANWQGGAIPQNATDTATFAGGTSGPATVTLDGNWTVGNINFNNTNSYTLTAQSGQALTLDNGANAANIIDTLGSHTIAAPLIMDSDLAVTVANAGDDLTFSGPISGTHGLTLAGNGTLRLAEGNTTSTLASLVVQTGATLDITTGAMAINFGSAANDPIVAIVSYLKNGYNGGTWTGTSGIISSNAAARTTPVLSIGYADGNTDTATPAAANQVLIKFTLAGDANLDGTVDFSDLDIVGRHLNTTGNDWSAGNFNYDSAGAVNFDDLLIVAQNLNANLGDMQLIGGQTGLDEIQNLAISLPEPGMPLLCGVFAAGLLAPRRRRSRRELPPPGGRSGV
jgi:hypothetical protein